MLKRNNTLLGANGREEIQNKVGHSICGDKGKRNNDGSVENAPTSGLKEVVLDTLWNHVCYE